MKKRVVITNVTPEEVTHLPSFLEMPATPSAGEPLEIFMAKATLLETLDSQLDHLRKHPPREEDQELGRAVFLQLLEFREWVLAHPDAWVMLAMYPVSPYQDV